MAPTGVVNSNPSPPANVRGNRRGGRRGNQAAGKLPGPKNPKQRLLLYGGLGVGAILLLSRHGSQAGTPPTDPNAGLADALAAQQAAQGLAPPSAVPPDPAVPPPTDPSAAGGGGGGGGGDTSVGDNSQNTDSGNTNSGNTTTIVNSGNTNSGNTNAPGKKKPPAKKPPAKKPPAKKPVTGHKPGGPAPVHKPGAPHPGGAPKPKTAPRGKPAPAGKGGAHPATPHKTSSGTKKKSPALVESIFGAGSGVVVMGRQFPGAISHRLGAPFRNVDGSIDRTVTIDYGGRTETHICHGNGHRWTDRAPGLNPPSRGVPVLTDSIPA